MYFDSAGSRDLPREACADAPMTAPEALPAVTAATDELTLQRCE